jgi:uncharacterized protein YukE
VSSFSFSQSAFDQMVTALENANTKIDSRVNELETYSTTTLAAWKGDAQVDYQTHKQEWDNSILKMRSIIKEQAIPALRNILDNYNTTERKNRQSWA